MSGLAMLLAACGSGDGAGGPVSIQPQPIPDATLASGQVDATTLTAAPSGDGIDVGGTVREPDLPHGFARAPISALDLSTPGAILSAAPDASGSFTVHLARGVMGDRVLLFFEGDVSGQMSLEVPTLSPTEARSPCVLADGALGLQLPPVTVGATAALALTFSTQCGAPVMIDGFTVAGDAVVQSPAAGLAIPASGSSRAATFLVTPSSKASYAAFVILAAGDDRYVFTLAGKGD